LRLWNAGWHRVVGAILSSRRLIPEKEIPTIISVERALAFVSDELWAEIRQLSQPISQRLAKFGWFNNKYYKRNMINESGCFEQVDLQGEKEIPYKREIFRPQTARFAIPNQPVAYLSNSFSINCSETIPEFRYDDDLSGDKLSKYFDGEFDPTPGWQGYPMKAKISDQALILDLTNQSLPLINQLVESGEWESKQEFLNSTILSRNPEVYRDTQLISIEAFTRGFQGICYQSVRGPKNVWLPNRNLVVFDRSIVRTKQYC
jgi:hypothetical protein